MIIFEDHQPVKLMTTSHVQQTRFLMAGQAEARKAERQAAELKEVTGRPHITAMARAMRRQNSEPFTWERLYASLANKTAVRSPAFLCSVCCTRPYLDDLGCARLLGQASQDNREKTTIQA